MKEEIYKISNFNLKVFLKNYEDNFKHIYYSLEDEKLEYIIDLFNKEDLSVESNIEGENLIDILNGEKQGLFLLIGAVADEEVRYFRFINGTQYRISLGEVYEHSAERFHDFKTNEDLIDIGSIDFNVEISLGLAIYKEGDNLIINFAQIKEGEEGAYLEYIYNSGDIGRLIKEYIISYS